jgi:alanine racemase
MIHLNELLALGGSVYGETYCQAFTDFSYDSRLTTAGELFLALHTSRADGHDYIPAALAAGAAGVLCSWLPRHTERTTIILADQPEKLIQRWASQRLHQVGAQVIAVSGSVGKTSTKQTIATLLEPLGSPFASRQSFNSLLGLPVALARLQPHHQFAVLEFGTDSFGEIAQLAELFPPRIGVITSIGNVYLQAFGSLDGIAQEKGKLIESLPTDGWAVLNGNDPYVMSMRARTQAQVITFGKTEGCTLQASHIQLTPTTTHFVLHWQGHEALSLSPATIPITLPLIGEPAVNIALAAAAVAIICGMSLEHIQQQFLQVAPIRGRLRPLRAASGALLIDDTASAALPSVLSALDTLAQLPARRRVVVLGDPGDQGYTSVDYQQIGMMAGTVADTLICKGDWGMAAIQAARQRNPSLEASMVYTATSTLQALPTDLGKDDLILVKGSAESRMERITAGLLSPDLAPQEVLVRQEPVWRTVRIGSPDRPTSIRVDLDAIAHNIRRLRAIAGVPLLAVVKADAYGHGAVRVARAALASDADALAVATLGEAQTLREADITAPVLVLGYTPPWQAREAVRLGVTCAIFEADVARAFSAAAGALQREAVVHVKVDTGMGRLGIQPEQAGDLLHLLQDLPHLRVEGLYSHFATADSDEETFARMQLERFTNVVAEITAAGLRPPLVHMANSAALLRFPEARFDMVRPGIACYGLSPSNETLLPPDFLSVLSFHTEMAQVKPMPQGASLSYGCTFVTQRQSFIGTIPVGYADGFRRSPPWREVLVRGQRVPVVGRVCMDYALLDVTEVEGVKRGDPVVIIGKQGQDEITADEVAGWLGTINYEVVSAILPRVPREVGE